MICGLLAGQGFSSVVDGDESIRRRPMSRIIEPLSLMGARIEAREGGLAPLKIHGSELLPVHYTSRVASAQVKTCVLFAGMYADGLTTFVEPGRSRDHTELMLNVFGAHLQASIDGELSIEGGIELKPVDYHVPGDLSSAAFFLAAATLLRDSELLINDVSLNPTRTAFLEVMNRLGANIAIENLRTIHGEPRGDLRATTSRLEAERHGAWLGGDIIPNIIDELPILAVAATQVEGRVEVREARELRVKESDRLSTVAAGIRALGGRIDEFEDGFAIEGPQTLTGGRVETKGDHRIAMAFTIAGLIAEGETVIVDSDCAGVSFPEFYDLIAATSREDTIEHE
jgi:3-phosphoshikimate 1-carboxyvinyltransferase